MIHQVAADLITGIGHATRPAVSARLQQQLGGLDAMCGNYEHLADRAVLATIGSLDRQRSDSAVRSDLYMRGDCLGHERRAGSLSVRDVSGGIVLGV
jgi:hypothetical protein